MLGAFLNDKRLGIGRQKPKPNSSSPDFCRAEFQKNAGVGKKDFNAVEYLLRKGTRQLEMYSSPGIRNIR